MSTFVVFDKPAIAMAINMRSRAHAVRASAGSIDITSIDLDAGGLFLADGFHQRSGPPNAENIVAPLRIAAESCLHRVKGRDGVRLRISSRIPVSVGLGSSASTSVATITAVSKLFKPLSKKTICELASSSEKFVHGRPSGIDQTICTYGGMIVYTRKEGFRRLRARRPLRLVVGNTEIKRSTGEWVGRVSKFFSEDPHTASNMAESAGKLVKEGIASIRRGELGKLGKLMNRNQALLEEIGVSTPELARLVATALDAGALGAKLTGGGGGGCMIAVCTPDIESGVAKAIIGQGGEAYRVKTEIWGVR